MPKYLQNLCAYHQNQILTNFCTCSQCLLPVCPTCVKYHTEQHVLKNTSPEYQKIDVIFNSVHQSYQNFMKNTWKLKEQLLSVQKVKKQNQSLILQKIKIYRNKIIREFEKSITDLEYQLTKVFEKEDQRFIFELQEIDKNIDRINKNIVQNLQNLQSRENGLRTIIFHISKNKQIECIRQVTDINEKIKRLLKKNLYLSVDQSILDDIKIIVQNYMKINLIDWSQIHSNKQRNQKGQFEEFTIQKEVNIQF